MNNLDQLEIYAHSDPSAMRDRIMTLPAQCQQAYALGRAFKPRLGEPLRQVLMIGNGCDIIGGDLIAGLLADESTVPIHVVRSGRLPIFAAGPGTLAVAVSVDGNNADTLAAFDQARAQGCTTLALVAGRALAQFPNQHGASALYFDWAYTPREAVGWVTFALLGLLVAHGVARDYLADVTETVAGLDKANAALGFTSPAIRNSAKRVAGQFVDRLPVIYGSGILSAVARRWKNQLNLNAKMLAVCDELPEANFNSVAGYEHTPEIWRRTIVIALRCPSDNLRISSRWEATRTLLLQAGMNQDTIIAKGSTKLAQIMSVLQYGDWVSYYTAIMKNIDPTPTDALHLMREAAAGA